MASKTVFPCPTCEDPLRERITRKRKPYFVCESCGVQIFVRFETGIERLHTLGNRTAQLLRNYAVCEQCEIAVRKSRTKVSRPLLRTAGIYCPECEDLLLEEELVP